MALNTEAPADAQTDAPRVPALITDPHLEQPDPFYEALIDAHRDLGEADSHALNARLVLLLANHIGSHQVLLQALQAARTSARVSAC